MSGARKKAGEEKAPENSTAGSQIREFTTRDPFGLLEGLLAKVSEMAASGDKTALENLWMAFNAIAYQLTKLADREPNAVNYERLWEVMMLCEKQLSVGLARKDKEALHIVFLVAEAGCELLKKTSKNDSEWLVSFSEEQKFWPCLLATKPMYVQEAVEYLERIRVGTKSFVPTKKGTAVESDDHWTNRAGMLRDKIVLYRNVLDLDERGQGWSGSVMRPVESKILATARLYPKVLELALDKGGALRPRAETRAAWWSIAKRVLESFWDENDAEREKDFKFAGTAVDLSARTYAIKKTAKAFRTLADAG